MFRLNRWLEPQPFVRNPFDKSAPPVPQDIKQVWFAGSHADIGGGYPEERSGLAKLPLDWMVREASEHGLKVNAAMRNHIVLGKPRAGARSTFVKPDPNAEANDSLTWGWRPLEWLPKSGSWREWPRREVAGLYLPRAEPRLIDDEQAKPRIHQSVLDRMRATPYSPANFPRSYDVEA
jgi:Uncharacterized alpha/beta hydrolase domain (DUF2235)